MNKMNGSGWSFSGWHNFWFYQYDIIDYFPYAVCCSPTSSVHFSHLVIYNSAATWTAGCLASMSITNSWSLLKLMSIEWVMLSNHLILCHPLLLLPSIFPSIRVFSNELALRIRWPKEWSFSNSPSNEYSGLISFRIDWFDLHAVWSYVFTPFP